jgi:hypothetical protein
MGGSQRLDAKCYHESGEMSRTGSGAAGSPVRRFAGSPVRQLAGSPVCQFTS